MKAKIFISLVAKPCDNFKIYFFSEGKTLLSANKTYINDLNYLTDAPQGIDRKHLYISWDQTGEEIRDISDKDLSSAIDKLLSNYEYDNNLTLGRNINLGPLFQFASTYGMLFKESTLKDHSLEEIAQHISSLGLLRHILSPRIRPRDFIPRLHSILEEAIKKNDLSQMDTPYFVSHLYGIGIRDFKKSEKNKALQFFIPCKEEIINNMKWDCENIEDYQDFIAPDFTGKLKSWAVESVMKYLESGGINYSVTLDVNKVYISAEVSSPTAYYLLSIKNNDEVFDKRSYDREYTKRIYPKLSSYFRSMHLRNKISKTQYLEALAEAKELCKNPEQKYETAKKTICEKIL